jgi:hypothetical protein
MPQEMRMKLIQSIHSGNQVVANYIKAQHNWYWKTASAFFLKVCTIFWCFLHEHAWLHILQKFCICLHNFSNAFLQYFNSNKHNHSIQMNN